MKVTLLLDDDADVFGIYVDDMLVYDYDLSNADEVIQSVAEGLGAEFERVRFTVDDTYKVPEHLSEIK